MLPMALSFFETVFNRTIKFDARTSTRLAHLNGRSLSLAVTDLNLCFNALFTEQGIQLQSQKEKECSGTDEKKESASTKQEPDVRVRAPIKALLAFVRTKKVKEATDRGLVIEGDLEIASEIQHFILDLDIDWEEMLSRCTGDIFAHQFFDFFKKVRGKQKELKDSFSLSAGNYFQEELRLLPTPVEIQHFNQSVDMLRDKVERLEVRVQLLLAKGERSA